MSITVTFGLSSMKMGAFDSRVTAMPIFPQSWVRMRPVCRLCPFTSASDASRRCVSSRWPISNENSSAGRCTCSPTCASTPSAKLVLPMPGRAPTMLSEDGWNPSRILSSSW